MKKEKKMNKMENVILQQYDDYTLIVRAQKSISLNFFIQYEFVVTWKFDHKTGEWAQGTYFNNLYDALKCFENKIME